MTNYAPDAPGLVPAAQATFHAAASGDSFDNNGEVLLIVKNADVSSKTVTVDDPTSVKPPGATSLVPDVAMTVPTTETWILGPFPVNRFNDANGRVQLSWSATTSVTWAAVRVR